MEGYARTLKHSRDLTTWLHYNPAPEDGKVYFLVSHLGKWSWRTADTVP